MVALHDENKTTSRPQKSDKKKQNNDLKTNKKPGPDEGIKPIDEVKQSVRAILYEYIKEAPTGNQFFSPHAGHKRPLVSLMMAVDKEPIDSVEELIAKIEQIAIPYPSMNNLVKVLITAITPDDEKSRAANTPGLK